MKLRTALLAATVLALPVAVKAQPVAGPYVGLGAGINLMPQERVNSGSVTLPSGYSLGKSSGTDINMRDGFVGVGSFGYGLGNGLRLEVEGNYRENAYQQSGGPNISGNEDKYGAMVNALYDFDLKSMGMNTIVMPYVGVGIGYSWADANRVNIGTPGTAAAYFNSTEGSLAYQAIVGIGVPIAAVPGLALTAEYRFFGLGSGRTYDGTYAFSPGAAYKGSPAATGGTSLKLSNDYNNSVLVGLRYAFNAAPPPPPAPPPAPVPAAVTRNYLVFFDWDRADLTDRARQIIAEAAANSKKVAVTKIQVNGYTDTSGTAAYNMKLSVRRAQSVASELVKDGVARGEISIQGFGETHLLVPTAQGVREPQNRRVEIILQ